MTRRTRATAASSLAFLLALTACSDVGEESASPAPTEPSDDQRIEALFVEPVEPEWTSTLTLIGSAVVLADDVLLAYALEDDRSVLVALDAATGEKLWSKRATPAAASAESLSRWVPAVARDPEGSPIALRVDYAYAGIGEAGGNAHQLEIVDVATGEHRADPPAYWIGSAPASGCGDEFCDLRIWTPDGAWYDGDVDEGTGQIALTPSDASSTEDSWQMTETLEMGVAEDYLAWETGDEERWRVPLSAMLPEGMETSALGSGFSFLVAMDDPSDPRAMILTLRAAEGDVRAGTVALALEDGEVLWTSDDRHLWRMNAPILCECGDRTGPTAQAETVTGVDVRTGEQTWSGAFIDDPGVLPLGVFGGYQAVKDELGAAVLLDASTGETVPVPADALGFVREPTSWMGPEKSEAEAAWVEYGVGYTLRAVAQDGEAREAGGFSRAIVAGSSSAWVDGVEALSWGSQGEPLEDPLDDVEARYFVQTAEGIEAYRF